ncbi:MAG: glycosyltransferase family 4 protein [Clostridiales bacterium]|jgi:glycosyltransferase involved in cell wall biosynthesis|nr:glycosyltransferase family 4 protein [Clostridiales bacterium]
MNVLHIISGGEVGGSRKHLLALVKNMDKIKCKNIILCFIKGKLYDEALELGIDIRFVEQKNRFDLSAVNKVKDICKSEEIHIVNCHGGRANFIGCFLKKKYAAKYVTTIHSDYRDDYRGNKYKTLVYSNINKIALKSFDYYITVSQSFKDMLVERGFERNKIFVVYNGIDFDRDISVMSRNDIVDKYGLDSTNHYVSMIGRFHPVKGHRVFLDACKEVVKKVKDVRFILVGDGELKEDLIEYVQNIKLDDYVKFVGWQTPDEFVYISDFTVLTSYTESFPLTILESAFYKKTVISTDVGGIPMLIEDGINGCLIKPGDNLSLGKRMLELLLDEDRTRSLGAKLYLKAKENYSVKNMAQSYIDTYYEVMTGGRIQ